MGSNGKSLYEVDYQKKGHERYEYPDVLSFDKEPFATICPSRSVTFKVHKSEGLANSALTTHGEGAKYKQVDGQWVKVWEFYEPTNCESCNAALTEQDKKTSYYWREGVYYRSPIHKGSAIFAPFLCLICYEAEDKILEDRRKAREFSREQKRRKEFDAKNKI